MKKNGLYWAVGVSALVIIGVSNITTTKSEEVREPIKYTTRITYDADIREGTREIRQSGKDGLKRVAYEVTYKNGSETSRKKISEIVVENPIDEEVVVGTKKYYKCSNGLEFESVDEKDECESQVRAAREKAVAPTNGRVGAICKDGTRSNATGKGACSHHGGVA